MEETPEPKAPGSPTPESSELENVRASAIKMLGELQLKIPISGFLSNSQGTLRDCEGWSKTRLLRGERLREELISWRNENASSGDSAIEIKGYRKPSPSEIEDRLLKAGIISIEGSFGYDHHDGAWDWLLKHVFTTNFAGGRFGGFELGDRTNAQIILSPADTNRIALVSPTMAILVDIMSGKTALEDLPWRVFEEMVADLLTKDGFRVTLGKGTKDDGVDIVAIRTDPVLGELLSIWQAKRYKGKPVGVEHVRELAYTTSKFKASKGMLVTTAHLTRGALSEIQLLGSLMGKKDRDEVLAWMKSVYKLP